MSIDTKALIKGKIELIDIVNALSSAYGTDRSDMSIKMTHSDDYYKITFYQSGTRPSLRDVDARKEWNQQNGRSLHVFYGCKSDYEHITTDDCTYLMLGCWGDSVQIMKALLGAFNGGWIIPDDSIDDWTEFKGE